MNCIIVKLFKIVECEISKYFWTWLFAALLLAFFNQLLGNQIRFFLKNDWQNWHKPGYFYQFFGDLQCLALSGGLTQIFKIFAEPLFSDICYLRFV